MSIAKILAQAIVDTARIREQSYDHVAADAAQKKADEEKAANPDNIYAGIVDYSKFYTLTLEQAAEQANKDIAHPVYLMLDGWLWNDSLDWANEQLKGN